MNFNFTNTYNKTTIKTKKGPKKSPKKLIFGDKDLLDEINEHDMIQDGATQSGVLRGPGEGGILVKKTVHQGIDVGVSHSPAKSVKSIIIPNVPISIFDCEVPGFFSLNYFNKNFININNEI